MTQFNSNMLQKREEDLIFSLNQLIWDVFPATSASFGDVYFSNALDRSQRLDDFLTDLIYSTNLRKLANHPFLYVNAF